MEDRVISEILTKGKVNDFGKADNVWFTSDTHFGHAKIIEYCDRPFADVQEMNETLVEINMHTITNNLKLVTYPIEYRKIFLFNILHIMVPKNKTNLTV